MSDAQAEEPVTKNEKLFVMFPFTFSSVKKNIYKKKKKKKNVFGFFSKLTQNYFLRFHLRTRPGVGNKGHKEGKENESKTGTETTMRHGENDHLPLHPPPAQVRSRQICSRPSKFAFVDHSLRPSLRSPSTGVERCIRNNLTNSLQLFFNDHLSLCKDDVVEVEYFFNKNVCEGTL